MVYLIIQLIFFIIIKSFSLKLNYDHVALCYEIVIPTKNFHIGKESNTKFHLLAQHSRITVSGFITFYHHLINSPVPGSMEKY